MSIKIPEGLRSGLEDGNLVEMRGTVDRKVNNYCTVQLQLNVTGVAVVQEQTISEDDLRRIDRNPEEEGILRIPQGGQHPRERHLR